jgi:hypothetical protein
MRFDNTLGLRFSKDRVMTTFMVKNPGKKIGPKTLQKTGLALNSHVTSLNHTVSSSLAKLWCGLWCK